MKELKEFIKQSVSLQITPERVDYWFDIFNEEVFENKLREFDLLTIKRTRGYYGMCIYYQAEAEIEGVVVLDMDVYELVLSNNLDLHNFLSTLAHEMVHLYQGQILKRYSFPEPESGDATFRKYNKIFSRYGLEIT